MKKLIYFSVIFSLLFKPDIIPQSSGNIPLLSKTKFNREEGVGDVWGMQINGTNYALVTLDGGLSIVNTENTASPSEIVHINHEGYHQGVKLYVPDVETFTYGGTTYAYLATNRYDETEPFPLVIIINVSTALALASPPTPLPLEILIDPINDTPNPDSVFAGRINDFGSIERSHTVTIAGNYLYVATMNDSLPVWYLTDTPTSPLYKGFVPLNPTDCKLHEMFVKSLTGNSARVYAATISGGLQVLELSYQSGPPPKGGIPQITVNSRVEHLYDFDRAYPTSFNSGDPLFNSRATHSAWPTNDGQYIFTTDELLVWPPSSEQQYSSEDQNLYTPPNVLKSPRREGTFLRVWDASLLGQSSSYKGGYYVLEEHPWGITNLTQIDTSMVPNSIHQMFVRSNKMYVAHYTQGFRYLDISDPENIIELGYYDDFPTINFTGGSSLFFRQNWFNGIYGVFPDPNRSTICYAGGADGFFIFNLLAIPYPPTNLVVTPNGQGHYVLSWTPSQSLNAQTYVIYRAAVPCCEPYDLPLYATVNAYQGGNPVTSWEDANSRTGSGDGMYYYEISMKNTVGKNSVHSNRVAVGIGQPSKQTAEEEETKEQAEQFDYSLSDNYPNPFNPSTRISYSLKEDALVSLKVYDILGTQITELVNSQQSEGTYDINFSAIGLSSGIYIYRLTALNGDRIEFSATKRMMLVK